MKAKFACLVVLLPAMVAAQASDPLDGQGFQWGSAFRESVLFLGIQHGFRLATEPGTRAELKGPFWRDYFKSVRGHTGWSDGDPFLVNYVGHPMMGAVAGFIQIQNDPRGRVQRFGTSREYWTSRLRAAAFSTAYSIHFEFGPVSETSIGNVGKDARSGVVDLVITPTVGMAWLIGEDALDRYVVASLERRTGNRTARLLLRSVLNPSRSFSNALRFRAPWHRDNREAGVSFN